MLSSSIFKSFTVDSSSWSSATFETRYGVLYESLTGYLFLLVDFGENKSPTNQAFTINAPSPDLFVS